MEQVLRQEHGSVTLRNYERPTQQPIEQPTDGDEGS